MARTYSMSGLIFAANAVTVIPPDPIAGVTYRDTALTAAQAADGWPYYTIVDSSKFNQIFYQVTGLLNDIEKDGILKWSALTDYEIGSICKDPDDNKIYIALIASGPNNGGTKQPTYYVGTYWKDFGGGGYQVTFASANVTAFSGQLIYCSVGGIQITLPISASNGDKVKIATSGSVSSNSSVSIVGGTIEGDNELIISDPFCSCELVYEAATTEWKVVSPVTPNI